MVNIARAHKILIIKEDSNRFRVYSKNRNNPIGWLDYKAKIGYISECGFLFRTLKEARQSYQSFYNRG